MEQCTVMSAAAPFRKLVLIEPESGIIGLNGGLREVFKKVSSVSKFTIPVLLTGETGSGKEVIANLIHHLSGRAPFVGVNCAAIPEKLMESELFGHVRGAFTGAQGEKTGKVELADSGTLFLDEIGELKPELQAKLLRVLQEKRVEKIGSVTSRAVDFRLITATNKCLEQATARGEFREDLYYRINAFPIALPSLAERKEDLGDLISYFIKKFAREMEIPVPSLGRDVLDLLVNHSWPGNIRELMNVIQRALILGRGKGILTRQDFSIQFMQPAENCVNFEIAIQAIRNRIMDKALHIKDLEKIILNSVLEHFHNNVSMAVKQTGISRDKFYRIREVNH